jgi:uncharacterized protein (DUF427 family)
LRRRRRAIPPIRVGDTVHEDLLWTYRMLLPESQKIIGLVSFYNEKVDLYIDDVRQARPDAQFG